MKRIAVAGLGKMGLLHASLLSVLPEARLVALCERDRLVRRLARNVFPGLPVVGRVRDLAGLGLDAVYVTTPPSSHFSIIESVLSEGIAPSIFVEKPLAARGADSEYLCRLADERAPGANMVGYNRRFSVTFAKAKGVLEAGTLGELTAFQAYAYSSDGRIPGAHPMGGILRDLGCHAIDLATWFFGELQPETMSVQAPPADGASDSICFRVQAASGLTGNIRSSSVMEGYRLPEIGMAVEGSSGEMRVTDDLVEIRMGRGESQFWHRHDLNDMPDFLLGSADYLREDAAFVRALETGSRVEPSFRSSLSVDQIIDQVEEQARIHGR